MCIFKSIFSQISLYSLEKGSYFGWKTRIQGCHGYSLEQKFNNSNCGSYNCDCVALLLVVLVALVGKMGIGAGVFS